MPVFPNIKPNRDDPFLQAVIKSGKRWVVIVDSDNEPRLVLHANNFMWEVIFDEFS